ncbi:SDR family NAD(P)-dependent oxidoreductase [Pseudomonas costantinii]|uniref:SDR family NAD(P)-dependent oxidoreductase n=1 Tax=Pseudomonas costantinii TaxID=168469 RepID=UPI0015A15D44|nr:SDR family NAD(P)-dependent oxidoreductase [Pseudomonas costantinii]NVZ18757.1 SDR family NAD(P)-dependent oxidoreductase [Pseudomonas costantinii]
MKAVIITGGTRGIGRAIVDEVARQMLAGDPYIAGARLVVTYRSDTRSAEALLQTLRCAGLDADVIEMDLEVPESINTFSSWVADTFESVGVLVNNAGTTHDGSFLSLNDASVDRVLNANLVGTIDLTEQLLPLLRAALPASVVFIASAAGVYGKAGQVPYATTKGGLIGYTQLLARRFGRTGLQVNAVAPGFIATEMVAGLSPVMFEPILNSASLGAMGTPGDVARVVCGLLQPGYIQATTIKVDGGHLR